MPRPQQITAISRLSLYRLVWMIPLEKLARELGITLKRTRSICRDLRVPCPTPEYWTSAQVGHRPLRRLPVISADIPKDISIALSERGAFWLMHISNDGPTNLPPRETTASGRHPLIEVWLERRATLGMSLPRNNLSKDKLRAFRALELIFRRIEAKGFRIAPGNGRFRFRVTYEDVTLGCQLREKQRRVITVDERSGKECSTLHQTGEFEFRVLAPIYKGIVIPKAAKLSQLRQPGSAADEIVALLLFSGKKLLNIDKERRENQRKIQAQEFPRLAGEKCWKAVVEAAERFDTCSKVRTLLGALRSQQLDSSAMIQGRTVEQWLQWIQARLSQLDPAGKGAEHLLENML